VCLGFALLQKEEKGEKVGKKKKKGENREAKGEKADP
jgi:hypothetical protein